MASLESSSESRAAHGVGRAEFICIASLITATIAMSIDAVLPAFDEIEDDFGLVEGGLSVTLTITVFFAAIGIGTLFWGPIADRFGRRPTMFVALGAVFAGAIVSSLAPTFEIFLLGRVLWGMAAAGPRTIVMAITRDSYEGDDMARIMSLSLAVFLIVPILAPGLGELLLLFGSWRFTTLAAAALSVVAALWFTRISETLDPDDVLPLEFGRVGRAAKAVVSNRRTALFTLATMMFYGSFFPWLSSSPAMFDTYGRETQFALFFGGNAIVMAIVAISVERLVRRFGTYAVARAQIIILIGTASMYVAFALASDGVPGFWVWFVLVSVLTGLNAGGSPLLQTMAMEPMGAIAGTASSVTGAIVLLGGSILGWVVDQAIDDTVTAFGVGFLGYTLVALLATVTLRPTGDAGRTEAA